jgi:hypothetical protein
MLHENRLAGFAPWLAATRAILPHMDWSQFVMIAIPLAGATVFAAACWKWWKD